MVDYDEGSVLEMEITKVQRQPREDGYEPVTLATSRGAVECRYYAAPKATRGAIFVGGAGGGWDSPAHTLYPDLCQDMVGGQVAGLRVRYRMPNHLAECTLDVLAGAEFLQSEGCTQLALTGHSFGGAVVIQAAAAMEAVRTVVALSTQSYGAGPAAELGPRCSLLLIHGTADRVLPPSSSQYVYDLANEPKQIVLLPGVGHGLDEAGTEVRRLVKEWLLSPQWGNEQQIRQLD